MQKNPTNSSTHHHYNVLRYFKRWSKGRGSSAKRRLPHDVRRVITDSVEFGHDVVPYDEDQQPGGSDEDNGE